VIETIEEYVDRRLRSEWGGHQHFADSRGIFVAPEVREGGATDLLIKLAAKIAQVYWTEENEELD